MAYTGFSDDFELDDDGILRDSLSSGGILIDDDGIIRDSFDTQSKYTTGSTGTHWTDSGLERDKQIAGSTSTLRQSDLQSYPSIDDISHPLEESHANISDLEASKDDLSFDADVLVNGYSDALDQRDQDISRLTPNDFGGIHSGRSSRSSFNNSLTFDDTDGRKSASASEKDLFDPEYYKQLQELGVLVDGAEFPNEKNSLNEFEELEAHVSRDNIKFSEEEDNESEDDIEEFLRRTPTREQLIGDVRGHRHGERYHDDSRDSRDHEDFASHTRPSTANSARTIGSEPFPEISPEEALKLYQDRTGHKDTLNLVDDDADSIEFQESQQTPGDDDEIFIITSRISGNPGPAKKKAYHDERDAPSASPRSLTPKSINSSRPTSRVSDAGSHTGSLSRYNEPGPQNYEHDWSKGSDGYRKSANRSMTPQSREGSITPVSNYSESRPSIRQGSRSGTPTNRPESVASQRSTASESFSAHKNLRQSNSSPGLSKARSQESFFEKPNESGSRGKDKMPKRLLPKPSANEMNKPLKVKSKSTTNLPAAKSGPMKPKRAPMSMSMSLVNIDIGEGDQSEGTSISERSRTELSSKLHQEFHKRKQATELVQQLQLDYDKLLSKYAQAELTIDQLRLGATVNIHSNSPTPNQATQGSLPPGQQPQTIQMGQMGRGVKSPSPFQGSLGVASPLPNEVTVPDAFNDRGQISDSRFGSGSRTQSESSIINGYGGSTQSEDRHPGFSMENGAESVKVGLKIQSQILDERMDSFQSLLEANEAMTHEEQEKVFDQIRNDHEKLRKDYLQYKEDYNALKRSNAAGDVNFDENKELEGELFKLGMKFDDIHEKVDEKRKQKHSERRPFQSNRLQSDSDAMTSGMSDQEGRSIDNMKKKFKGTKAGNDLVEPKKDTQFQKNLARLHDEYNALMDRYRRLKQMAQTPERDKEIDNLVRKLHEICHEEPDVFRMPQELNDRTDNISISPSYASHDTSLWDEDETDYSERWEQLQRGDDDGRVFSRRQSEASQGRRPSKDDFSRSQEFARTENKSFTKGGEMQNGMGGSSNSLHRSDLDLNNGATARLHDSSMSGSRDSLSSRTRSPFDSTFDRDSPTPRLPRPRRHDHPERRSNNLKKLYMKKMAESDKERPESGSFSSLQDSGISEHEGANGKERGATGGPLSNLPGPGTFKQMTKQRHAGDADSGFIGSMVGSEVSQMSSRQPTLRLRQQSDSGSDRPRSRSSRADDTASIASSRSSRRGQQHERPHSRDGVRPKNRQSKGGQTRDYTDDSYTLTTESEMSFDIPERKPRRGADARRRQGSLERIIQEEEEERPRSILSSDSRRSQRSEKNQQTPMKAKKQRANVSFSSKSEYSDEDVTPKPTPNQSFNESRELFSSEEDTPRETVNLTEQLQPQQPVTISQPEPVIRPPTPKEPPRPPTPGIRTPRSERSATPVKPREVPRLEMERMRDERPRSRGERPRSREEVRPKVMEDRGVGSDSDDTARVSVATAATQGSQSSDKFKMLQEEIGRLREAFQNATQQPQPVPMPLPPVQQQQPQPQNQDQYFDPTEDPYAFMMGPRRRANSFSGAPARDWDDYWRYPLNPQQDDIPLGYAAADSFNPNRQVNPEAVNDPRGRRRMRRRYKKPANTEAAPQNDYESDQSPSHVTASNATDEQLFNYYVPQYSVARTQTAQVPQGYFTPQSAAPRMQHYSSQPNLLQNSSFQTVPPPQPQPQPQQQQNMPTNSYATPISAGYSRLRPALRRQPRQPYSYDDLDMQGRQPVGYIISQPSQGHGERPPPPMYVESTAAYLMSGGAGYHTHGDYVYEVPPPEQPPVAYVIDRPPRVRVRPRSKSASRVRHFSPDGRLRSRYLIRNLSPDSSSTESDDDIVYRQRSRTPRRRTRTHRVRKYRKSHEFEDALNQSLNLTEEIDALTHRCIGKVSGELAKARKKKDFGSSYW